MNFLENSKLTRVANAAVAGQTTLTSSVIDMKGLDTVTFIAALGDVTDTGVVELRVQQGDQANGSDAADIAGVSFIHTADPTDADNKLIAIEVNRPLKRYVRVRLLRTVANSVLDGIVAVQTNPAEAPVTQDSSVLGTDFALSPE